MMRRISIRYAKINQDDLVEFLIKNPNPTDKDVHKWAEDNGYNKPQVESEIYKLATNFIKLMFVDGFSNEKGNKPPIAPDQLRKGIKVELEHTSSREVAEKISRDHLREFGNYYDALDKMEKELKTSAKS